MLRYAAVAVAASLHATISLLTLQSRQQAANRNLVVSKDNVVARVVQRIDCVMQDEKWSLSNPHELEAGQTVRISEGLAILKFSLGAQVTLQGPAELEIVSDNSGFLHSGKLTASVPPEAIGFEILTPNCRVIDHRTAFGISVAANGDSETLVFDGEVELIAADSPDSAKADDTSTPESAVRKLKETMAERVRGETGRRTEANPASPENSIRTTVCSIESPERLASITGRPQRDDLVMWFEAGQGGQLDGQSRVISWQNFAATKQLSATADSISVSSAWQVNAEARSLWIADEFASHPAIRFGGNGSKEFLATTPIQTGDDATVFVVCRFGQDESVGYGHIVSLGDRTRMIVERKYFDTYGTYSWSWSRAQTPHFHKELLEANAKTLVDIPFLCAIRYSQEQDTYELFVNGQFQSEGQAIGSLETDTSHVIGCDKKRDRFFSTAAFLKSWSAIRCWTSRCFVRHLQP